MTNFKTEFIRNENIIIAADAPKKFKPSQLGWVISSRIIENDIQSRAAGYSIGTIIYLIEYMDGSDIEMPADFIRHR